MTEERNTSMLSQAPDSKQQQVYKLIRDAIVKNEFPPGTVMVRYSGCKMALRPLNGMSSPPPVPGEPRRTGAVCVRHSIAERGAAVKGCLLGADVVYSG